MKFALLLIVVVLLLPLVAADLDVSLVKVEPSVVTPGSLFSVTFEARNSGTSDARNVQFELLSSAGLEVEGDEEVDFSTIKAGEKITLSWLIEVRESASPGFKSLELKVDDGDEQSVFVPVQVRSLEATLTVDAFSTKPSRVAPGEEITLIVDFRNNARFSLKNVKATLDLTTTPFSPVNGINENVIDGLDAGERVQTHFELIAGPESEAGTYKIPLSLRYFDEFGVQYNQSSLLSITIGSVPALVISQEDSSLVIGQRGETSIKFVNNGLTKVKLLTVTVALHNAQLLSSNSMYLGDIDADDFQTIDLVLLPQKAPVSAELQFTFKDANNNDFNEKITLPLTVYTPAQAEELGIIERSNAMVYVLIVGLLAVLYIGYKIFRRRH